MNLLPMKSVRWPRSGTIGDTPPELTRKSDICAKVLAEARKLSQAGQFGTLPNQLVVRAGELLDDMDEILVALDPARNRASFALAAALHRELEQVQATLTDLRKRRGRLTECLQRALAFAQAGDRRESPMTAGRRTEREVAQTLRLDRAARGVDELYRAALAAEQEFAAELDATAPSMRESAYNLVHYLAVRRHDVRELQDELTRLGLSSLGRLEAHVMASLQAVLEVLCALRKQPVPAAVAASAAGHLQYRRRAARRARQRDPRTRARWTRDADHGHDAR